MAKKKVEKKQKKVYIRTYLQPDGKKLVLRSDQVSFADMSPKVVREKYNIPRFLGVIETMEFIDD